VSELDLPGVIQSIVQRLYGDEQMVTANVEPEPFAGVGSAVNLDRRGGGRIA
jgi:hypothetical protein